MSSDRHNSRQSAAECSEALACDWSGFVTWPPARAPIGPDGSRGFLIPTPENCARMQNKLDLIWNYQLQNRGSGQILNLENITWEIFLHTFNLSGPGFNKVIITSISIMPTIIVWICAARGWFWPNNDSKVDISISCSRVIWSRSTAAHSDNEAVAGTQ